MSHGNDANQSGSGSIIMTYLAACSTTPAAAARMSADRGDITHIECPDAESASRYELDLLCLLDDSDSTVPAIGPIEVWGTLDGDTVRVHIIHG